MEPPLDARALEDLAGLLRGHPAMLAKAQIGIVRDELGPGSFLDGPGDDGAVVAPPFAPSFAPTSAGLRRGRSAPTPAGAPAPQVVVCGEALLPAFVAADPYAAGFASVLTNVNDLAAMGAAPVGIVDTVVGPPETAHLVLRGMRDGSERYDVPLVGGHLTIQPGQPAVSAFGVGYAEELLSCTRVAVGQTLVVAACLDGTMREDFPFFPTFDSRVGLLAEDVRLLPRLATSGACVAAKDVSMAGLVGSLAMLLEWGRLGVTLDLRRLPRPADLAIADWLTCFPAYCFLLCTPADRAEECVNAFTDRGLAAAAVGTIDDTGLLALESGAHRCVVLDLAATPVTGLR